MGILRHIVGIASELLTLKDPYDTYVPPEIVSDNGCTQIVRAQSHADATAHLQGYTIQGDRTIVATRIGHNTWRISTEPWNTKGIEQKFEDPRNAKGR